MDRRRDSKPMGFRLVLGLIAVLAWPGCGDDHHDSGDDHQHDADASHDEGLVGSPSGAVCPEGSTLDYDSFGRGFMEDYCVRCHSSELEGPDRNNAPAGHDFDSFEGIIAVAEHIDQKAAAGPDAENMAMPPDGDKPSLEEREMLGEWLACELQMLEP